MMGVESRNFLGHIPTKRSDATTSHAPTAFVCVERLQLTNPHPDVNTLVDGAEALDVEEFRSSVRHATSLGSQVL